MTPQQGERFLPSFLEDDDYHLALANREPGGDNSLGVNYHRPATVEHRIATTATRNGGDWVVNGVKDCVANAPIAKLFAVEAQQPIRASSRSWCRAARPALR